MFEQRTLVEPGLDDALYRPRHLALPDIIRALLQIRHRQFRPGLRLAMRNAPLVDDAPDLPAMAVWVTANCLKIRFVQIGEEAEVYAVSQIAVLVVLHPVIGEESLKRDCSLLLESVNRVLSIDCAEARKGSVNQAGMHEVFYRNGWDRTPTYGRAGTVPSD